MDAPTHPRPPFPSPTPPFDRLAPSHYRVLVRRAQNFTAKQIAAEFDLRPRTVTEYLDRSKKKLGMETVQDLIWAFYSVYAPGLWPPDNRTEQHSDRC